MTLRRIVTLAATVAVLASASPVWAQTLPPTPDAVFYELTENMKVKGNKMLRRIAKSALAGVSVADKPFCPLPIPCDLTAIGSDSVSLTTGLGSFKATIVVVVQGDNPVDPAEFIVDRIKVKGPMDFSPALVGVPLPWFGGLALPAQYGTIVGQLAGGQADDGQELATTGTGTFTGVFRLPFDGAAKYFPEFFGENFGNYRQILCPLSPTANNLNGRDLAYIETGTDPVTGKTVPTGRCIDIVPEELSLNAAAVRFDVWF